LGTFQPPPPTSYRCGAAAAEMEKILKIFQPPPPNSERFRRAAVETLKILKNFSRRRR
jgi:hypothetical protein